MLMESVEDSKGESDIGSRAWEEMFNPHRSKDTDEPADVVRRRHALVRSKAIVWLVPSGERGR